MQGITQDLNGVLRGFKMVLDFNKLVFAFLGAVLSILWILIIIAFFSALELIDIGPFELINVVLFAPGLGLNNFFKIFLGSILPVDWAELVVLFVLVIGLLAIWSVFGGSITRLAALEFAKNEKIGFKESVSFALKKFWSYFWSPLTPAIGALFFAVCNIVGGFIGQIKYVGEITVAIGFPLAILSGFLIVFIGAIGAIGFILMFPTISAEGSDAFDAMSRAYSYVISKPVRFITLFLSIIICGAFFTYISGFIACVIMNISFSTVGFGMGQKFESIRTVISGGEVTIASLGLASMKFTALMLMIYIALLKVIVASMVIAFMGSASTIAYFFLRKEVDGTETDDVYIEEKEMKEAGKTEPAVSEEKASLQEEETKKEMPEEPEKPPSEESG